MDQLVGQEFLALAALGVELTAAKTDVIAEGKGPGASPNFSQT
jgi:hypothetical protein